jgi:outer membrane protein
MKKSILTGFSVVVLLVISFFIYHKLMAPKVGYIEISKVFNGFQMKKELQGKYEQTEKTRKKILDSLSFNLQLLARDLQAKSDQPEKVQLFQERRNEFMQQKKNFEEDNLALSNKFDKQILEQMTQYVLEFGEKNSFDIIYGADGNGNVMYAHKNYNVSEEVLSFINRKYNGLD